MLTPEELRFHCRNGVAGRGGYNVVQYSDQPPASTSAAACPTPSHINRPQTTQGRAEFAVRSGVGTDLAQREQRLEHVLIAPAGAVECRHTGGEDRAVDTVHEYRATLRAESFDRAHGVEQDEVDVGASTDRVDEPRIQMGSPRGDMGRVQGMLLMRHMMFVGYSLKDEDFHELMHEVRAARGDELRRAVSALHRADTVR